MCNNNLFTDKNTVENQFSNGGTVKFCVVCREENEKKLTKHHCVPVCFRKHFPRHLKLRADVVSLCDKCHTLYEKFAVQFQQWLLNFWDSDLSAYRKTVLRELLVKETVLHQDVIQLNSSHHLLAAYLLDNSLIDRFMWAWRAHFMMYAKPQALPENWWGVENEKVINYDGGFTLTFSTRTTTPED